MHGSNIIEKLGLSFRFDLKWLRVASWTSLLQTKASVSFETTSTRSIPASQSRCIKFHFGQLPAADVRKQLHHIAGIKDVDIVDERIDVFLKVSSGLTRSAPYE